MADRTPMKIVFCAVAVYAAIFFALAALRALPGPEAGGARKEKR